MSNHSQKRYLKVMLAVLLLFLACTAALAQYDTGSIVGVVRDKTGAALTDAKVTVTNTKTGRVYEVTTGKSGEFDIPGLPESTYKVEATHAGFKAGIVTDVVLHATDRRGVDVTLEVGAATEEVTVIASAATVNTQTSESGASIDSRSVSNLPLNGRDFTALLALVPGSVTTGGFGQNSLGGYETTFAGVNILLDGTDATRIDVNATSTQLGRQESRISRASVDSIQEFKVLSGTYSAEYGRSSGDVVNVITKSGGNQMHGTLFDFFRNDALDAKNYFQTQKTPLRLNQFGGNLSGAFIKDKLFYFVNYEGVRQIVNNPTGPVAVLTAAAREPAVASIIPVINAIPLPNTPGPVVFAGAGPGGTDVVRNDLGYYEGNLHNTLREDTGSVKVDYIATAKDNFSFRFNVNDSFTSTQYGIATGQVSPSPSRNFLVKGTWNHSFSPSVLNEFGVAFNRPNTSSLGGGGDFPIFVCSAFWGCNPSNTFVTAPGPALFSSRRPQHSLEFLDKVSWVKGRHAIRAGLSIRHAVTQDALDPQAFLAFDSTADFLANFAFQLSTLGHTEVGVQNTNYGFFLQDDVRVTPRLTLNLGLRYDYNTVLQGDQIGNFDIATLTILPQGKGLYNPDRNNFGPRVGFSWDPNGKGKTVIRGGAGIFYSPELTGAALSLAGNYQQGFNINIFDLFFFGITCDPPLNLAYPVPNPLPKCNKPLSPNVNSLDPNQRDSYTEHYSFGIQQELAKSTVLEVGYVGNVGRKLPAGAAYAGAELNLSPFFGVPNLLSNDYGQIRRLGNWVTSSYNALQVSLRRRVANGLNLDANYTWAHEFDNGVNILGGAYQNSRDPKGDYSPGDIDVRNNFTVGAVYDIPTFRGVPKALGHGWQVTSLLQARSGLPVLIALSSPFLGIDQLRPNLVPGVSIKPSGARTPFNQFNKAAFSTPAYGTYGNTPRNYGRGPGFTQLDFGLAKTTQLTERTSLQIRAEMFNLLNHPNFSNPSGILDDPNFGKSTSTIGARVGTGTSRQAQLAIKLLF